MVSYSVAGDALRTIRTNRLYRQAGFSSFDTYRRERWGWTRQQASRLEAAAQVFEIIYDTDAKVSPMGDTLPPPRNERAARELAPLRKQPDLLVEALISQRLAGKLGRRRAATSQKAVVVEA